MNNLFFLTFMSIAISLYLLANPNKDNDWTHAFTDIQSFGNPIITAANFSPANTQKAPSTVLDDIEKAARSIWDGTSPYLAEAPDMKIIAHATFDNVDTFIQFHINWVNVETGGNYNLGHTNVSHQHDGTPEMNYGIYQINERWGLNNPQGSWGRNSNPWGLGAEDVLFDVEANANIAWNHLIAMRNSPDYKADFWSALDIYWHGNASNNAYSEGVKAGEIIDYSE